MSTKTLKTITVVLASECQLFQDGFRLLLEKEAKHEIELLDVAFTGYQLLDKVKRHKPDIAIATNHVKEIDTAAACGIIKIKYPKTSILFVTDDDEEDLIYNLIRSGVDGIIVRHLCREKIIEAIKKLSTGLPYHCPSISDKVFYLITKKDLERKKELKIKFSDQELKVIQLICKQYITKEIADKMHLCSRTVEEYRHRIQEKMGVKNVAGLVLFAVNNDLLAKENSVNVEY